MGASRQLMIRWMRDGDPDALESLRARRAVRSGTRDPGNVVGCYGEYLVWRCLGGERLPQASPLGDLLLASGRYVEVKARSDPFGGWALGYRPAATTDYALVRISALDWRVVEAWLVPFAVAKRYVGPSNRLPANGLWRDEAMRLPLHRF